MTSAIDHDSCQPWQGRSLGVKTLMRLRSLTDIRTQCVRNRDIDRLVIEGKLSASDSVVDAFDYKHDAAEAQRVRRGDRRFDLDQFWIAKLRQLKLSVPVWGPHHNDVDLNTFEPVDAVHP